MSVRIRWLRLCTYATLAATLAWSQRPNRVVIKARWKLGVSAGLIDNRVMIFVLEMDNTLLTAELKAAAARLGFQLAKFWRGEPGCGGSLSKMTGGWVCRRNARSAESADAYATRRMCSTVNAQRRDARDELSRPSQRRPSWPRPRLALRLGRRLSRPLRERLNELAEFLARMRHREGPHGVVDTAPLLEREFAQLAGLGWIGKNTLLLNRQAGSWFFLAALLTDLQLVYDGRMPPITAAPAGRVSMLARPVRSLSRTSSTARRCISYLTIELRLPSRRSCGRLRRVAVRL